MVFLLLQYSHHLWTHDVVHDPVLATAGTSRHTDSHRESDIGPRAVLHHAGIHHVSAKNDLTVG